MNPSKLLRFTLAAACVGPLGFSGAARAESIYALTSTNSLVSFDSGSVATVSAAVPITGTTGGEAIVDIDYFAVNQTLYGIGAATGTLYQLDRTTGVATVDVTPSTTIASPANIDFNPMANRLRIIGLNARELPPLRIRITG